MAKQRNKTSRKRTSKNKTRKRVPWAGWKKASPSAAQKTKMLKNCGRKCFLGPKKSFPICTKNTCKINKKGVYAAYIRARQWGKAKSSYKGKTRPTHKRSVYTRIARRAKKLLRKRTRRRRRR